MPGVGTEMPRSDLEVPPIMQGFEEKKELTENNENSELRMQISDLQKQVNELKVNIGILLEDRKHLQTTGQLNRDPETKQGGY